MADASLILLMLGSCSAMISTVMCFVGTALTCVWLRNRLAGSTQSRHNRHDHNSPMNDVIRPLRRSTVYVEADLTMKEQPAEEGQKRGQATPFLLHRESVVSSGSTRRL